MTDREWLRQVIDEFGRMREGCEPGATIQGI
jgi:hypothetical protein